MANKSWWAQDETIAEAPTGGPPKRRPKASANWWDADETIGSPTGEVHDGDTFRLDSGKNARLFGVDAPELKQTGIGSDGRPVPIGLQSRSALADYATPDASVAPLGSPSYGRPVVGLENAGQDAAIPLLRDGQVIAAPKYLAADPERHVAYNDAERFARMNHRGAFDTTAPSPEDFRRGNTTAMFFDEARPVAPLRPEVEKGYLAVLERPDSTIDDVLAYAAQNGFSIDRRAAEKFIANRAKGVPMSRTVGYEQAPRVLTNPGDGALGAGVRGFADPINMLDEMGGVVDTLVPGERENVWQSDRRFGDILWSNIEQNRSILDYDDENHPYARFGGQLASGVMIPGGSVRGVGVAAARGALRSGAGRFAAEGAAKRAVTQRLATVGAVEGTAAGVGAGETTQERITGGIAGGTVGAVLGTGLGLAAPKIADVAKDGWGRITRRGVREADGDPSAQQFVDGAVDAAKSEAEDVAADPSTRRAADLTALDANKDELLTYASRGPDAEADVKATLNAVGPDYSFGQALADIRAKHGTANMAAEGLTPAPLTGPRTPDVIGVQRPGLMADGPGDRARMQAAEGLEPGDVLPLPSNTVRDLDEAESIAAGRMERVKAPNESKEIATRSYPSPRDGTKTVRSRGPADLVTWLRTKGGLDDRDGWLGKMGVDNTPRKMDFTANEGRLGNLVDRENGAPLDIAAHDAWEHGFFSDFDEPPTPAEFLDAIRETYEGRARRFHPDDEPEVEAFLTARDQRHAVEAAEFDGAPLTVDKGQPIEADDLDEIIPPVKAYEAWGENAPDFAGNINLTKLNSPQEIRRALTQIDRVNGGFDAATRGRITHAETEALAAELGMTTRDLMKRKRGQAFNAEQALAARQILAKAGNEVVNLARKISRGDASERDMLTFRRAVVQAGAIQEQVAGMTAEAGRALSAMRAVADAKAVPGYVLREAMESLGGEEGAKLAAETILNASTPGQVARAVKKLNKPGWFDKGLEYYYNSMLSGPQTHAVNILSNTLTALGQIPETAAAAAVGAARTAFAKDRTDRVLFSEVGARTIGMLAGGREGLKNATRTFLTGELSDQSMKVETARQRAIGGKVGSVIRTPTRALAAEDEFFKAIARRSELYALAVRQAGKEGKPNNDKWARVAELVTNPTEEMEAGAHDFAKYQTFQRSLSSGHGISQGVQMTVNKFPVLKLALPFVRTPANLMKFAMERSLAAPLVKEWRKEFAAGGARRDAAIGKFIVGNAALGTVWGLAEAGLITGAGPADDKAKDLLRADGWQPYSFKVGDKYYAYQRFDPFAALFGTVANFHEVQTKMTDRQRQRAAMTLVSATIKNLGDKVWLSGLSDLVKAADEPERYWDAYAKRLAGSVVPAGLAQIARTIDPTLRETDSWLDAIKARTPGLSKSLAPKRDVLGREIVSEGGVGPDIVSPLWTSTRRNETIPNALLDAGIGLTKHPAFATIPEDLRGPDGKDKIDLTRRQRSALDGLIGDIARPQLSALVGSSDWGELDSGQRKKAVGDIIKGAREDARSALLPSFVGRGATAGAALSPGLAGNPDAWWMKDETIE